MVNRTIQMKRHKKSKTVTAKSVQKKWQRNIFLIDSGSTEQQVLHIRYLKFHQKTAVLQNAENKQLGTSVADRWQTSRGSTCQQNTKAFKIHQQNMRPPPPRLTREILVEPDIKLLWVNSVETNSYRTRRSTCSVKKRRKRKPRKRETKCQKKKNNNPKARFRQEQTAISNMHWVSNRTWRDQKTDTKPNKRNVYSIKSAYPIEFGRRGGSELGFPVKFQKEIQAVKHEEDRRRCADTSAVQVSALHQCSAPMYNVYIDF